MGGGGLKENGLQRYVPSLGRVSCILLHAAWVVDQALSMLVACFASQTFFSVHLSTCVLCTCLPPCRFVLAFDIRSFQAGRRLPVALGSIYVTAWLPQELLGKRMYFNQGFYGLWSQRFMCFGRARQQMPQPLHILVPVMLLLGVCMPCCAVL